MKKFFPTLFAAAGMLTAAMTSAQAQEIGNWGASFSANASVANDYIWRGVTQTDGQIAVQGGFDVEFENGFSLGTWGSNIDYNDGTWGEFDLYGGYSFPITDMISGSLSGLYVMYPGQPNPGDFNFVEITGGLEFDLGPAIFSTSVAYSPDYLDNQTWYFTTNLGIPLGEMFELFGGVNYYEWENVPDYWNYSVGLSTTWENFTLSTYWVGTDFFTTYNLNGDNGTFVVMLSAAIP